MHRMANLFTTKNIESVINKRVAIIKVPNELKWDVAKLYLHIRSHCGSKYAVERFKILKQCILNYASSNGEAELPLDIWMKKKSKTLLKGPIGRLQVYALQSPKCLENSMKLMNLYTVEVQTETSKEAIEKFRRTVTGESTAVDVDTYKNLLSSFKMKSSLKTAVGKDNIRLLLTDVKPAGNYFLSPVQKPHHERLFLWQMESFIHSVKGAELVSAFSELFSGIPSVHTTNMPYQTVHNGVIHRIPQPGLKDRWVLDFLKPLEHVLHPFGKRIYQVVDKLPWDITFHEDNCWKPIQEHLRQKKTAYAVDLSNATDRFPWELQRSLLMSVFGGKKVLGQSIKLLDELIKLPSTMPDGTTVQWSVGQPLGAYPSFGIFTLTHGCLLFALNGYKWDNDFFVHGDDVVILDEGLYLSYIKCLQDIGVEFNPWKTLVSNRYTEINAKLVSSHKVHTIPKWKPFKKKNAIDSVRYWGMDVLKFIIKDKKQLELAERICSLPYPIGSGLNPEGLSLDSRIEGLEALFEPSDREPLGYIGSYRRLISERFNAHETSDKDLLLDPGYFQLYLGLLDIADEADKALSSVYRNFVPVHEDLRLSGLGKSVYSLDPNLDLPLEASRTRARTSTQRINILLKKVVNS